MINKIILTNIEVKNTFLRLSLIVLIVSFSIIFFLVPSQMVHAGWIESNWFGSGGNWFWDDILGIDPKSKKDKTPEITSTCLVNKTEANVGESITWSVLASGGTGSFTYVWSGSDNLSGTSNSSSKIYTTIGTKTAKVVITSGKKTLTKNCATINIIEVPQVLSGSCSVNPSTGVKVGDSVIWSATASGATGVYSYVWSGSDSLFSYDRNTLKTYITTGTKTATVLITSGGQSVTRNCSINILSNNIQNNNYGDVPEAETESVQNVTENSARIKGSIDMNDYQNGRVFFVYGENRNLIRDVKDDYNTYSEIDEDGDDLRKVSITSNLNGSDSFSYNIRNLNNNTDYYYSICVQYRNESGSNRLSCGGIRKFTTEGDDLENLYASCYASPSNPQIGMQVNWYCDVSGGTGSYSYSWSGSDGLNSTSRSPYIVYNSLGTKTATVTIRDGSGNRVTKTAYVNINSVLGVTQVSQPYIPMASAVYLSQIPNTGLADNYKLSFFLGFIALVSAWIAYIIISYNKEGEEAKLN